MPCHLEIHVLMIIIEVPSGIFNVCLQWHNLGSGLFFTGQQISVAACWDCFLPPWEGFKFSHPVQCSNWLSPNPFSLKRKEILPSSPWNIWTANPLLTNNHYLIISCDYLQVDVAECASAPCQNGGTCSSPSLGVFVCTCAPGWTGESCEGKLLKSLNTSTRHTIPS